MGRDKHLDFISGLLIIWMILLHVRAITDFRFDVRYVPFLFCFMAWFFFKSGMYHRQKETREVVKTGWKRLMIPYIVFSIIGLVIGDVVLALKCDRETVHYILSPVVQIVKLGGVSGDMPIWYLLSLFMVRVAFNCLLKIKINPTAICIASFIVAFLLNKFNILFPCYLGNVSIGLCFYSLGYIFKDIQYDKRLIIPSVVVYAFIFVLIPSTVDVRANTSTQGIYVIYYLSAFCSIIILNNMSKAIWRYSKILTILGEHSMTYYLAHWPVLILADAILNKVYSKTDIITQFIVVSVILIITLPVIDRLLHKDRYRFMIGEQ